MPLSPSLACMQDIYKKSKEEKDKKEIILSSIHPSYLLLLSIPIPELGQGEIWCDEQHYSYIAAAYKKYSLTVYGGLSRIGDLVMTLLWKVIRRRKHAIELRMKIESWKFDWRRNDFYRGKLEVVYVFD